jgi:hypothetical protein
VFFFFFFYKKKTGIAKKKKKREKKKEEKCIFIKREHRKNKNSHICSVGKYLKKKKLHHW